MYIFCEEIPFRYHETRISERAASWISAFLCFNIPISTVQRITRVYWDTIKHIQEEIMDGAVADRQRELLREGYKPKHLAVDEFASHKGHRYATCVMDLDTGDVLWVGKGRTKADFANFFHEMDMGYLSEVEAVAMDMNASYNALVSEHMPWAEIVYDRYHMQAQFGKDVLGAVRLDEVRKNRDNARQLKEDGRAKPEIKAKIYIFILSIVSIMFQLTKFQLTLPMKGATRFQDVRKCTCPYFNSRSHEGSDISLSVHLWLVRYFNSRSHEGSDVSAQGNALEEDQFQFTLP